MNDHSDGLMLIMLAPVACLAVIVLGSYWPQDR
jgi:hypothetical protein